MVVKEVCKAYEALTDVSDPTWTLKASTGLWCLAIVGGWLSPMSIAWLGLMLAFSVPAAYTANRAQVDAVIAQVSARAIHQWRALGLDRRQRFFICFLVTISVWLNCNALNRVGSWVPLRSL